MECEPRQLQSNRAPPAIPFGTAPAHETPPFPPADAQSYSPPLLLTKLTAPRLPEPSGLLVRSGLIDRILDADRARLTVVCAEVVRAVRVPVGVLVHLLLSGPTPGLPAPRRPHRRLNGGWAFLVYVLATAALVNGS